MSYSHRLKRLKNTKKLAKAQCEREFDDRPIYPFYQNLALIEEAFSIFKEYRKKHIRYIAKKSGGFVKCSHCGVVYQIRKKCPFCGK